MKTSQLLCFIALCFLLPCDSHAQASFQLANKYSSVVDAPVFDGQGVPLAGPTYLAELWGAATPEALTPLLDVDRGFSRVFAKFVSPGYFFSASSYISVISVRPYGSAWLQVRVWDASLGATYEDVVNRGLGGYGESPLFYAQGGDPFDQFPYPAPLIGLQSFNLRAVVPEPSTWALLVLGGLGLAWAALHRKH